MAEGDGVVYNDFKEQVMLAVHNLGASGHTIQLTLHTGYTPNIDSHQVWTDVSGTEYTTGAGYTAGGAVVGSKTITQNNTNDRGEFDAADVTWTSLGPLTPATPSHCILWNNTPSAPQDPLIAYFVLGTTATNGGNYTIQWNTSGILLLT